MRSQLQSSVARRHAGNGRRSACSSRDCRRALSRKTRTRYLEDFRLRGQHLLRSRVFIDWRGRVSDHSTSCCQASVRPDLQITVIAHTDDLGSASIELATGQERLNAVRKRLEESKIVPGRIRTENHGSESRSDEPCADEECRRKKRRVDFLFRR